MTARKKVSRKKVAVRKRSVRSKSALGRIGEEPPKSLLDFGKQVRENFEQLECNLDRAIPAARRRTARIIREASQELGRIEERRVAAWRKRAAQASKDARKLTRGAQSLLLKLGRAVAPPPPKRKKKAVRMTA